MTVALVASVFYFWYNTNIMMNNNIKNFVGLSLIIALLVGSFAIFSYSRSYKLTSGRSFFVSGEGETVAVPDVAQFTFGVLTEGGKDVAALQKQNSEKANNIIEFVKKQGVDKKDVKTTSYNVQPRYQYFNCRFDSVCPPAEIIGYTISQSVEVKARDFDKIGALLSGAVDNGANNVSQLYFTIDDRDDLENEARAKAIAKARAKAEALAKAGGFRLGKLLEIQESPQGYPMPLSAVRNFGVEEDAATPSIEPGSQEVKINVTLKFEIK